VGGSKPVTVRAVRLILRSSLRDASVACSVCPLDRAGRAGYSVYPLNKANGTGCFVCSVNKIQKI